MSSDTLDSNFYFLNLTQLNLVFNALNFLSILTFFNNDGCTPRDAIHSKGSRNGVVLIRALSIQMCKDHV